MEGCTQVQSISPHMAIIPHPNYVTNFINSKNKRATLLPMRLPSLTKPSKNRSRICLKNVNTRCLATSSQLQKKAESDSFFANDTRPIMLFDGVCNLCNGGVKFVRDNDPKKNIRYVPLQSQAGRKLLVRSGRLPDDISSVVLVEKDRSFIKSEAVLRILTYLDLPYPPLAAFLHLFPLLVRDVVYDTVANNRYAIFGKSTSCAISDSPF
uniref:Thiol-disulfide oxidoreductase DCC n=1 Tax=Araucaria cunninghamii TaxID=56994 RepID=A0A0D6R529_ARACU